MPEPTIAASYRLNASAGPSILISRAVLLGAVDASRHHHRHQQAVDNCA
jgi:hypothetical protein